MKVLVILLFSAYALVDGFPGKFWEQHQPEVEKSVEKHWQFEYWKVKPGEEKPHKEVDTMRKRMRAGANMMPNRPNTVHWCVTTLCEMKKCKRMTTEFNYRVTPRMRWSCVKKNSKEACMEAIQHGLADIMTAEGEEIYKAGKIYDMKPIMVAKYDDSEGEGNNDKHYSIVLVKKTNIIVNTYEDMRQKKSCHPGMDTAAAFKAPMCSLINQGIVPKVGNVYESAGEFFKESCVPGVQHMKYNPNMTNPESLCRLCKGTQGKKDQVDFCMTMSPKEPHYGFSGAMNCLREGHGDVGFFHTYDIAKHYQQLSEEFDIVCKKERQPLAWENIAKEGCHLTVEHPQVVMVSKEKPTHWIRNCTVALENAAMQFSSQEDRKEFSLFDSSPYCPITNGQTPLMNGEADIKDEEELDEDATNMKNEDLIFKHHYTSLEKLPTDHTYKDFLTTDMSNIWKTCEQLQPKPRAFICVVGDEEMAKCMRMVDEFYKIQDLRHKASWGCVKAISKEGCVELVTKNAADIVQLNATEMFLAGKDHNLAPFMGFNNKGKDPLTESITIGIMLKNSRVPPKDMRGMKMCNAGVHKISGFLHPMGWLWANGTIERSTSFLQSIRSHFGDSCVPGINTVDLMKHPLLSQTLDWETLMHDTKWEDYYKTPMWRKWEDKKGGADNDYKAMHKEFDFHAPEFQKLRMMLTSEDPSLHAFHTPKIHQMMELLKKDFSWTNYVGLEDFYGLEIPKWKLISWVWQKPKDCTDMEWDLFMTWAEYLWDVELDYKLYTDMWTDEDWKIFKEWMNTEYGDYIQDSSSGPMHKDFFIRMSLLSSRYYWLIKQWKILQWDNIYTKHFREKMCKACAGDGDMKCSMDTASEHYYDYKGAMKCLKEHDGDVAFVDWYAIKKHGFQEDAFALLCPDGKKMNETGRRAVDKCNFGHVPSSVLVTCNMHDGVWRWKITKAILEAQKILSTNMFKDGIFGEETESLSPIPLVNQTYQVVLGPEFLRAMEGIIQNSVKVTDWSEELDPNMCEENCWNPFKPEMSMTMKMKMKMKMMKMNMGRHGKGPMMPQKVSMRPVMGMWKKKEMMLWKPKGQNPRHIMWNLHKVPTSNQMGPKMGPKMDFMAPMEHGMKMKMAGMKMHHETLMEPMKHGMKTMMPNMMHKPSMGLMKHWKIAKEIGHQHPMMEDTMTHGGMMQAHIDKSIHSEFYSKVIFARNGTCNAIVDDLSCFGKEIIKQMWAGRVTKTPISVPMCYKPTIMEKTMVQFNCDTGAGFGKSILLPMQCSYTPCNLGFWVPDWTDDQYWDHDSSYSEDYWGSKDWWKFDKRGDNDNWFLEHQHHQLKNHVDKHLPWNKEGLQ